MSDTAKLTLAGKDYELPLTLGSEKEVALDISKLRAQSGAITLDPGYTSTGSCTSSVTFIDGEKGILRYRGYPIEQLCEHSSFIEVSYLLINGELPTGEQLEAFKTSLTRHTLIHEDMRRFFEAFPPNAHPMAILSAVMSGLSTFYQDDKVWESESALELNIHRILAKLPTIAAYSYKKSRGMPIIYPDNSLEYTANFLRMMFGFPTEPYEIDPDVVRALDVLLILHADHEQNCSTSTVRMAGSSQVNLFASMTTGICALWGPRHGGANQAVLEMLGEIRDEGIEPKKFLEQVKDKSSNRRLMGFGHRVYKNFDPRARIIKVHCDRVLEKLGIEDPLLDIAKELESVALEDDYFAERKLYPNVDFYSGIIYRALGFPTNMFTVLFAIGRLPGWIAQWKEMKDQNSRIARPRQVYVGPTERAYTAVADR
ncbi:MAG: citrate synthase [Myxococcota bacterium]